MLVGKVGSFVAARRRGLVGVLALVALAVVVLLATRPWSTTSYDLHATGVWVVNEDADAVGRVNPQLPELDHVQDVPGGQVFQDGDDAYVLVQSTTGSTLRRLLAEDPSAETPELRFDGLVFLRPGGGVVGAVADGEVIRVDGEETLTAQVIGEAPADSDRASRFVVGVDGTIAVLDPAEGEIAVASPDDDELQPIAVDAVGDEDRVSLTLVGERPVVLDESDTGPRLLVPGQGPIPLDGLVSDGPLDMSLQQPGPAASTVVVGTEAAIAEVDLADGSIDVLAADGVGPPVAPVVDDGCTFGAWRGGGEDGAGGAMVVVCDGDDPVRGDSLEVGGKAQLRTGSTTVLNDYASGAVHVAVDGRIVSISGWPEDEEDETTDVYDEVDRDPLAKVAPVAVDDTGGAGTDPDTAGVGARPGRVTFLPVLRNDFDENGDVLAVDDSPETFDLRAVPEDHRARFGVAQDGRSIVVDLTDWQPGDPESFELAYHATDGDQISREPATVEVEVVAPDAEGRAPQRQTPGLPFDLQVQTGQRATRDVLSAFWDHDGDPLYLAGAEVEGDAGHSVSWQPDGRLTFSAAAQPGEVSVALDIRDVTGQSVEGTLVVTVDNPDALLPPVLNNDVVAAVRGVAVTVDPLANDVAPSGEGLTLAGVPEVVRALDDDLDGLGVAIDPQGGGVTFIGHEPGRYVVHYEVENDAGPGATVLVRVAETAPPPLVRPDVVVVEENKSAELDLLANDLAVDGAMMSVTGLELPADGLRVPTRADDVDIEPTVEDLVSAGVRSDLRTFRVDALADAVAGTVVNYDYTVSTARAPGRSTVTVVVVASEGNRLPVTRPVDGVRVRAGGAATVPLDRFAFDPDLDPLEIDIPADGQPSVGDARPSGTAVRYFAPADATGEAVVAVEVADPFGTRTAILTFEITPADAENQPPTALEVEARTRAGREVVIPIPLDFRDPDGDDVRIQGRVGSRPLDGEVELNPVDQTFTFTPRAADAGAVREQEFEYTLVDEKGAVSEPAVVRVLVAPAADDGSPPVAAVDRVIARPEAVVFVDPVLNDTDLDRDPVRLAESLNRVDEDDQPVDEQVVVDAGECTATVVEGRVRIETASDGEVCRIAYGVTDADPEDDRPAAVVEGRILVTTIGGFPGVRPSARNDYPARSGRDATSVMLNVLANDEDLDGDPADLRVALVDVDGDEVDRLDSVRLEPDGTMSIAIADEARMVRYRITDDDDLTADAVVRVPGRADNRPPELVPGVGPIVLAEEMDTVTVDLSDHIIDPDGDEVVYLGAESGTRFDVDAGALTDGRLVLKRKAMNLGGVGTLVVEVSDDADPPARAALSLPVEIEGVNTPPQWRGDPCGPVNRGAAPTAVQLRADDIDPGDTESLVFSIVGSRTSGGVEISVGGPRGAVLTIDPGDAPVGGSVAFDLGVTDGASEVVVRRCIVQVQRSAAPPLVAADRVVVVDQGETETFPLESFVSNAQGGLEIVDHRISPAGLGQLSRNRAELTFAAVADASGQGVITYTVADSLDDPTDRRRTSGRITVTVRGRPDTPTNVQAVLTDEGTAVALQWTPGDDNGAAATFDVSGGGVTKQCSAAACTVTEGDGLSVDGRGVSFTVVARNDVGPSGPSQPSNTVYPDSAPTAVRNVRFEPIAPQGDGTARWGRVTWAPPQGSGSDVVHYLVGGMVVTGTEQTISPVADGDTVTVVAVNRSQDGTERESPPATSPPMSGSYGRPSVAAGQVRVQSDRDRSFQIDWSTNGNGRGLDVRLGTTPGGCTATPATVSASAGDSSGTFSVDCDSPASRSVTFTVQQAGPGGLSATSQPVSTGTLNTRPTLADVTITGGYQQFTLDVDVREGSLTRAIVTVQGRSSPITIDGADGRATIPASAGTYTVTSVEVCNGALCSQPTPPPGPRSADVYSDPAPPSGATADRDLLGGVTLSFSCTFPVGREIDAVVALRRGGVVVVPAFDRIQLGGGSCGATRTYPLATVGAESGTLLVTIVDRADSQARSNPGEAGFPAFIEESEPGGGGEPGAPAGPAGEPGLPPTADQSTSTERSRPRRRPR